MTEDEYQAVKAKWKAAQTAVIEAREIEVAARRELRIAAAKRGATAAAAGEVWWDR